MMYLAIALYALFVLFLAASMWIITDIPEGMNDAQD